MNYLQIENIRVLNIKIFKIIHNLIPSNTHSTYSFYLHSFSY